VAALTGTFLWQYLQVADLDRSGFDILRYVVTIFDCGGEFAVLAPEFGSLTGTMGDAQRCVQPVVKPASYSRGDSGTRGTPTRARGREGQCHSVRAITEGKTKRQ
jgi:hypothetical protein